MGDSAPDFNTASSSAELLSCRTHPLLGEQIQHHQWGNGFQLWSCPRPGRTVSVHLTIAAGSLDRGTQEMPLPPGIAHFLEHRLFEKQEGDLSTHFAAMGADIDAETGYRHTSFTCDVQLDALSPCVHLLARLVTEPYFPQSAVELEREIIQREIDLYEDNVDWVAFQAATRALYGNQPIAEDIAGTPQSLAMIDERLLTQTHAQLYRPERMQLIVTGPVAVKDVLRVVDDSFGAIPPASGPSPLPHRLAIATPTDTRETLAEARPRLWLGLAGVPPAGQPREGMRRELHLEWILDILLGGSSPFFSTHYESALIDGDSFGSEIYVDEPFSFCLIGGDTDDPIRLGEVLLETLRHSETPARVHHDFDRASRRAYGELVTSFEDPGSVQQFIETAVLRSCHPFDLVELFLTTSAHDLVDTWENSIRLPEAASTIVGPNVPHAAGSP